MQDFFLSCDNVMTRQAVKIEELETQNKSLEERLSALETRMNTVDLDMGRASTSINSIVRGTEHDFDILRVEVDLLKEQVPVFYWATFDVTLTKIGFLGIGNVEQSLPL